MQHFKPTHSPAKALYPMKAACHFSLDTVVKRSNMDGTLSLEMPIPSSFTAIETNCPLSITIKDNRLVIRCILKGIGKQVKDNFLELITIYPQKNRRQRCLKRKIYIFFCCQQPEIIHYIMKHDNDIPVFNSQAHFFILYLSEIQYLINEQ
jgi:hypothetical protein